MTDRRKMKTLLVFLSASVAVVSSYTECRDAEWKCDNNRCVPKRWMCDGDPDCSDGSDEKPENCQTSDQRACRTTEFKCGNGNCIPKLWKCDGADDCRDNSDEDGCSQECRANEFQCQTTKQCIDKKWKCDGAIDCEDRSDEADCPIVTTTLAFSQFRCQNGVVIPKKWVCDGEIDCIDKSDELDCDADSLAAREITASPRPSICRGTEFQCGSYCIMNSWVCDGTEDCINGEDEKNCKTCPPNHIQCLDTKQCLSDHHRCNGHNDCEDGSDENDCPTLPPKPSVPCDPITQYECGNGKCIGKDELCNEENNCEDWEDESEEVCGINECERNNGGCTQKCINTREGHYCDCDNGYRLVGKYTCEDIDECQEIPGTCSQKCINTVGGYHCTCLPGYKRDPGNYTRCKAEAGEPYLLFSHKYDIRSLRLKDKDMSSIISDAQGATALDYKFTSNEIIWSNNKENEIVRAQMTSPGNREILVRGERVSADGLAVDWIHNHIYFTDTGNFQIKMLTWDAAWSKTIVSEGLGQPRAIVVSPFDGYIFWTDWGSDPKIERAGLDGSDRTPIVREPHVFWPNGITLDHSNNHIYWCDGKLNSISRANLDGSHVEVILFSPSFLRLPYSISVFEDRLYWTDWSRLALFSADKFNGGDITSITAGHLLESPKVVHVFHKYRQPSGENVCESHQCSHFCIRTPAGTPACACPDGMILSTKNPLRCLDYEEEDESLAINTIENPKEKPTSQEMPFKIPAPQEQTPDVENPHPGMTLGVALGATVILAVGAVMFVGWWKTKNAGMHSSFQNPIFKKTRDAEMDSDGFVIRKKDFKHTEDELQYTNDCDTYGRDDDEAPLTPEKKCGKLNLNYV